MLDARVREPKNFACFNVMKRNLCIIAILASAGLWGIAADAPKAESAQEKQFIAALQEAFRDKSPEKLKALCCWDELIPVDRAQWDYEISDLAKKIPAKIELLELDELITGQHRSGTVYYQPNLKLVKEVSIKLDDSKPNNSFRGGIGATYGLGVKDGKLLIAGLIPIKPEDRKAK